jgi:hypothetical protein
MIAKVAIAEDYHLINASALREAISRPGHWAV